MMRKSVSTSLALTKIGLSYLIVTVLFLCPIITPAQERTRSIDKDTYESMFKLGVSNVAFFYSAFQTPPSVNVTHEDMKVSLQTVADSYKHSVTTKRGTVALLNNSLDVALAGTDYASAGTAFIATVPIRWAKSIGVEKLVARIDKEAAEVFAKNLDQIKTHTGLEYEQLQALPPDQIAEQASMIPDIRALKDKLRGEKLAEDLVDKFVVDTVTNVQKATLIQVAQQSHDISNLGKGLESVTRAMASYVKQNNERLDDLTGRMVRVEVDVRQAKIDIENLKATSIKNTQQLQLVGDVLYSRSDPADRLVMLNGGYLKDRLPDETISSMKRALESEVKKQELLGKMNSIVSDFNKIGLIVNNLGINAPELGEAISIANGVSSAMGSFATGDYIGAIVGITGIFGKRTDPNAERHKQLMNYLKQEFAVINRKLDQIIEGQQRIMEGIIEVSKQMAEYDKALHQRLTRIEDKIDSLEGKTYSILYSRMGNCSETYKTIRDRIGILDSTRLASLHRINPANAKRTIECGEYMRQLFNSAFNPDVPELESLALRNSASAGTPALYKYDDSTRGEYYANTGVQNFISGYYRKTEPFVLKRSAKLGWTVPNLIGALSIPSVSTKGLKEKVLVFQQNVSACDSRSKLSDALISLLCQENDRQRLPEVSGPGVEGRAEKNGLRILRNPVLYDATSYLAEWSLFYAPIYDVMDFKANVISEDLFAMLKAPSYRPEGKELLEGAARINSVALAQMNMMQGDITSKFLFDVLWDPARNRFIPEGELSTDEQKEALAILKLENPYLLTNVLMLALDASSLIKSPGAKYSYQYALQSSGNYTLEPFAAFKPLFGNSIAMQNDWAVNDQSASDGQKAICAEATKSQQSAEGCVAIPVALVYGISVPLPSSDEYANRELKYPFSLKQMVTYRDRLATRLADYDFIEWAVKDAPDKNAARIKLVNALINSTN